MTTARIAVSVQTYAGLPEAGIELTEAAADASNGNRMANPQGNRIFIAHNSGASTRTITHSYLRRGQTVTQTAINLLAGKTMIFGPYPSEMGEHASADGATGDVYITAAHAEVLVSALELPGLQRVG